MRRNKTLEELFAENLTADERVEVEARAAAMLAEVRLAEVRKMMEMTQEDMAAELGRRQSAIAAFENRDDMLVSTLRRYAAALGGELDLILRLPQVSVHLKGIGEVSQEA